MTPNEQIANLARIQRKMKRSYTRAVSTTRRGLSSQLKRQITAAIPKLKTGLNSKVDARGSVTKSSTSVAATIVFKSNQPNARRFVINRKGTWSRASQPRQRARGRPRRRVPVPGGGLFLAKPTGGRVFIKGAFLKKIKNQSKALAWRRLPGTNKITPVRGYTSRGLLTDKNKQVRGFLQREFGRKGIIMLEREYARQMELP